MMKQASCRTTSMYYPDEKFEPMEKLHSKYGKELGVTRKIQKCRIRSFPASSIRKSTGVQNVSTASDTNEAEKKTDCSWNDQADQNIHYLCGYAETRVFINLSPSRGFQKNVIQKPLFLVGRTWLRRTCKPQDKSRLHHRHNDAPLLSVKPMNSTKVTQFRAEVHAIRPPPATVLIGKRRTMEKESQKVQMAVLKFDTTQKSSTS